MAEAKRRADGKAARTTTGGKAATTCGCQYCAGDATPDQFSLVFSGIGAPSSCFLTLPYWCGWVCDPNGTYVVAKIEPCHWRYLLTSCDGGPAWHEVQADVYVASGTLTIQLKTTVQCDSDPGCGSPTDLLTYVFGGELSTSHPCLQQTVANGQSNGGQCICTPVA